MKKIKITILFDTPGPPPENQDYTEDLKVGEDDIEVEYAVAKTLKRRGHEVMLLGFYDQINTITKCLKEQNPQLVFNLCEHFRGQAWLDRSIADLLEILGYPYTGSSATALLLARNKAITKEILTYHRVKVPQFATFHRNRKMIYSKKLIFPLIVKPLSEDASVGIAQASIVNDDKSLRERVTFVHESLNCDAIAEEFIVGREFYVSIIGNQKLRVLPLREMKFGDLPNEENQIATFKAKWDLEYRNRWDIKNTFANNISDELLKKIKRICKRSYRALRLRDYGRIDIRVTPEENIYVLEANPNPYLAKYEDFPEAARKAGMKYHKLLERIINLSMKRYNL